MLVSHAAVAQSGKLIDAVDVQLSEEALTRLAAFEPTIRDIVAQVEVKAMTYLSDGLRVKGYLAAPKQGDKLPCVIFNRGGNRAFGAIKRGQAAARSPWNGMNSWAWRTTGSGP